MDDATVQALKTRFAQEWIKRPHQPERAAFAVFPDDGPAAVLAAPQWINDPFVLAEVERLRTQKNEMDLLPTKAEVARELWKIATYEPADGAEAYETKDRLNAMKLYAELRGFITSKTVNNDNRTLVEGDTQKVLVVQNYSREEWEAEAVEQQRQLISDANS